MTSLQNVDRTLLLAGTRLLRARIVSQSQSIHRRTAPAASDRLSPALPLSGRCLLRGDRRLLVSVDGHYDWHLGYWTRAALFGGLWFVPYDEDGATTGATGAVPRGLFEHTITGP